MFSIFWEPSVFLSFFPNTHEKLGLSDPNFYALTNVSSVLVGDYIPFIMLPIYGNYHLSEEHYKVMMVMGTDWLLVFP